MGAARATSKRPQLGPLCANPGRPPSARVDEVAADYAGVAVGAADIAARITDEAPLVASCSVLDDTLI